MRVGKTNTERARLFFCVVIFFLCWCCYYFVKRSFFSEEEDATLRCAADDDGTKYRCKHKKRSLSTTHTTVHWRMTKVLAASCCGGLAPTKLEKHKQSSSKSAVRKRAQAKERVKSERAGEWVCERTITQASFLLESFMRERERESKLRTAVVVAASFAIDLLFNYNCLLHCALNLLAARKK